MTLTDAFAIVGLFGIGWLIAQGQINRRAIMAQVDVVLAAVAAARQEIEADKAAIIAEIQRLGLPDEDLAPVLDAVAALGTVLDDVPGVTPPVVPPVEPPVS